MRPKGLWESALAILVPPPGLALILLGVRLIWSYFTGSVYGVRSLAAGDPKAFFWPLIAAFPILAGVAPILLTRFVWVRIARFRLPG